MRNYLIKLSSVWRQIISIFLLITLLIFSSAISSLLLPSYPSGGVFGTIHLSTSRTFLERYIFNTSYIICNLNFWRRGSSIYLNQFFNCALGTMQAGKRIVFLSRGFGYANSSSKSIPNKKIFFKRNRIQNCKEIWFNAINMVYVYFKII